MGVAPPQMGRQMRQIHQQTVNTPTIGATTYFVYFQTLPVNPIGDGFTLDSWCLTATLPTNFTLFAAKIWLNWYADPAGTSSPGYVELPLIGPVLPLTNPAASSQFITIGIANAFSGYYFGNDVQTQGGFARYWQMEYQMTMQNAAAVTATPTLTFMVVFH